MSEITKVWIDESSSLTIDDLLRAKEMLDKNDLQLPCIVTDGVDFYKVTVEDIPSPSANLIPNRHDWWNQGRKY